MNASEEELWKITVKMMETVTTIRGRKIMISMLLEEVNELLLLIRLKIK
jgi:hypothetical protein